VQHIHTHTYTTRTHNTLEDRINFLQVILWLAAQHQSQVYLS